VWSSRNDEEGGRGKEMKRKGGRKRKDREDGREKKVEGRQEREVEEGRKMRQIFTAHALHTWISTLQTVVNSIRERHWMPEKSQLQGRQTHTDYLLLARKFLACMTL